MFNPFDKLRQALARTKETIVGRIAKVIARRTIDDDLLEEIEQILIEADLGVKASLRLIDSLKRRAREEHLSTAEELMPILRQEIVAILTARTSAALPANGAKPEVWLIVGVNGVGKTTTIGKLATHFARSGRSVMIAACDTFRAAAIEQVSVWAERSGVEIIRTQSGADPAAVAFDAATAARSRHIDLLLVDTAGRLHTKGHLMDELRKIDRVVRKAHPDGTIKSKLILDGTTGQNALSQVKVFTEAVGCDGLIITKLDGTAKGGVVIAIAEELGVPVDFIGVGEGIDDLMPFEPEKFADAIVAL